MKVNRLSLFGCVISLSLVSCNSIDAFVPNEIVGEIDGLSVQNGVEATFTSNPRYLGDGTSRYLGDGGFKLVTFGLSYRILREQSITEDIHFKLFPGLYPYTGALFPPDIEYYGLSITNQNTLAETPLLIINEFASSDYSYSFSQDDRLVFPEYFNIFISFEDLIEKYSLPVLSDHERGVQLSLCYWGADGDISIIISVRLRLNFDDRLVTFIPDLLYPG